jgi:hypothetical protein
MSTICFCVFQHVFTRDLRRSAVMALRRTEMKARAVVEVFGLAILLALPQVATPQSTATATQTLSAELSPIGKLSVPASVTLAGSGATFGAFSGTLVISNRVRTTPSGSGSITLQATSDFTPSGGPKISNGVLTYTCTGASLGTPCSGTQTVSGSAQTPVLSIPGGSCTGGGSPCSATDPNSVNVNFVLTNDPAFHTGAFSAQLTLVISAT